MTMLTVLLLAVAGLSLERLGQRPTVDKHVSRNDAGSHALCEYVQKCSFAGT